MRLFDDDRDLFERLFYHNSFYFDVNDFDSIKELHLTPNKTSVILINIELTIICKQLSE